MVSSPLGGWHGRCGRLIPSTRVPSSVIWPEVPRFGRFVAVNRDTLVIQRALRRAAGVFVFAALPR